MATRPLTAAEAEIVAGLDPEFQAVALRHREAALAEGLPFEFLSGLRSRSQQAGEAARTGRTTPAAPAGASKHEVGFAYDIEKAGRTTAQLNRMGALGEALGLKWGGRFQGIVDGKLVPTPDPNHFEAPQPRATLAAYRNVKVGVGVALLAGVAITVVSDN